jgi:hypothetical protein
VFLFVSHLLGTRSVCLSACVRACVRACALSRRGIPNATIQFLAYDALKTIVMPDH